ncbi:MAG: glutathione S-transferase N-terminal domain-containing protein [Arenicellales bacterium]|jgi:GST-like protein|nr:glutathione S-transferase N-terminal domain-containing protein [Arenicellales bacterium]|tara:strand:- start:1604 stop:2245 length:642 start_codon:yes stop_codon:yes gene_type:complete
MIELYTWSTPNGRKISIALEELGWDYTVYPVDITQGEQRNPAFIALSPNNKIPAIVDTENGQSLMESGAILLYLAKKSGQLIPAETSRYWETIEWLMWQMAGPGPMLGQIHHFTKFNPGKSPYAQDRYLTEGHRLYSVLDKKLQDREFVVGEYSIADIALWPWISRFEWQTIDITQYPNVIRWYLSIASRPAVQRGYHVPRRVNDIPLPGSPQ